MRHCNRSHRSPAQALSLPGTALLPLLLLCGLVAACGPGEDFPQNYVCSANQVVCIPPGSATGSCVNLNDDPANCGGCGVACPAAPQGGAWACVRGACQPYCTQGRSLCQASGPADGGLAQLGCVDTGSDPANCGTCGNACPSDQTCKSGSCVAAGPVELGTTACGGSGGALIYRNLAVDTQNCGACGLACANNEVCASGSCTPCAVTACIDATSHVGACADTSSDPANCGACGAVAASCAGGTALAGPVITLQNPAEPGSGTAVNVPQSQGGAPGPTLELQVLSGLRPAAVVATVQPAGGTASGPFLLTLASPLEVSPTLFTLTFNQAAAQPQGGTATVPALAPATTAAPNVSLTVTVFDEQYRNELPATDPANLGHSATRTIQLVPQAAVAITAAAPSAALQVGTSNVDVVGKWIPLNGGTVTLSTSVTPAAAPATVSAVEFRHAAPGGTPQPIGLAPRSPLASGSAQLQVRPADLGLGLRDLYACPLDLLGNDLGCSPATQVTVGTLTPAAGSQPVLARGSDRSHSIWLLGTASGGCTLRAQAFDEPASQPGAPVGTDLFQCDQPWPTPERSGVYAVTASGSAVARFDCPTPACENAAFLTPPAGTTFARIPPGGVTAAALAVGDATPGTPGLWFGAVPAASSTAANVAVSAAGHLASTTSGPALQSTKAGALAGFVWTAGQLAFDLFHPAIAAPATHLQSWAPVLDDGSAKGSPITTAFGGARQFTAFPGGELVWEYVDASGNHLLDAARFDPTAQPVPVALKGAVAYGQGSGDGADNLGAAFFVPKPGVVVGAIPSPLDATQYQVVEIDLTRSPPVTYQPVPVSQSTGGLLADGVATRAGDGAFTVSDDLSKVLFVTADPSPVGSTTHTTYSLWLLDLASGTASRLTSADTLLPGTGGADVLAAPHFLRGAGSYASPAHAPTSIVVWNEGLPLAQGGAPGAVLQRIGAASFGGGRVVRTEVDRVAEASAQGYDESAVAGSVFFLSRGALGLLDLYQAPLYGTGASTLLATDVAGFQLREDSARILVMRNDGALLTGTLAPGATAALTRVAEGGVGGSLDPALIPITWGFNWSGRTAWLLVHPEVRAGSAGPAAAKCVGACGAPFLSGALATVDLATGQRTNWGEQAWPLRDGGGTPLFLGQEQTLFDFDTITTRSAATFRLFLASGAAPLRRTTVLTATPGPSTATWSVDGNEALLDAAPVAFAHVDKTLFTGAIGTQGLVSRGASEVLRGQEARALPALARFGGDRLPELSVLDLGDGSVWFKQWGGATARAPIRVAADGGPGPGDLLDLTRQLPDQSELHLHFRCPGGTCVMQLPGAGKDAPVLLPQ